MKFIKAICALWVMTNASSPLLAQTRIDSLAQKVERFGKSLPQEKVFLHLDNSCYFVGDTIWYSAYVTRSDNKKLTDLSRIVYVDLFTPDGFLVERQQLEMPDGTAHGAFAITDSLYAGYYELRAYTRWMLNFGVTEREHSRWSEEEFYNKHMADDFFRDYDKLYSRVFPIYDKPATPGDYTKDMTMRPMRRYYKSKKGKPELSLTFFPEGGSMVEGTSPRVAFELNTAEGEHLHDTIKIVNHKNETITQAVTIHRGRGVFTLPLIAKGDSYKATFSHGGYDYSFDLPKPEAEGCTMQVGQTDGQAVATIASQGVNDETLGLQVMHQGIAKAFHTVKLDAEGKATINTPLSQLPTGVNQFTLFNAEGRIYADRLIFVNHHDYDTPMLEVSGLKKEYTAFEPIEMKLTYKGDITDSARVSLSVRDLSTDEPIYDDGTALTEMLLSSELKGFVEAPGWYFQQTDDSLHLTALDLLMMVQGWRRYSWHTMAGIAPMQLRYLPEKQQTLSGCVNKIVDVTPSYGTNATEFTWNPGQGSINASTETTENHIQDSEDSGNENGVSTDNESTDSYDGSEMNPLKPNQKETAISNLKEEVNIYPSYIQGTNTLDVVQSTENGSFYTKTPLLYDRYILMLPAASLDKGEDYMLKRLAKGHTDEESFPDYYVKLNRFYPLYTQPYGFYRDAIRYADNESETNESNTSFTDRQLGTVTVRTRRGGYRKLDLSKPALVVDAYDAFNHTADYGLNSGTFNWVTFARQVALSYIGDMGLYRKFFLQIRYDGKPINSKFNDSRSLSSDTMANGEKIEPTPTISWGRGKLEEYHYLKNLDKLYIYTDYCPREQGSSKYEGSNQPDVVIDYRRFAGDGYQKTYRDRYYVLQGYSVCDDFYNPNYEKKPLPTTADYRRTLLWLPQVKFDNKGQANIKLYQNNKTGTVGISAQGFSLKGKPIGLEKK